MTPTATLLLQTLKDLQGRPLQDLPDEALRAAKSASAKQFRAATAGLQSLLLGLRADAQRWVWDVEDAEPHNCDLIATYQIHPTDTTESAIDLPEKLRMAAGTFLSVKLQAYLFGEFVWGNGEHTKPRVSLCLAVSGADELEAAEFVVEGLRGIEPTLADWRIHSTVSATAGCVDDLCDPADLPAAYRFAAQEAREDGEEEYGASGVTETIELSFEFAADADPEGVTAAIRMLGAALVALGGAG